MKAGNCEPTVEGAARLFEPKGILDKRLAASVLTAAVAACTQPAHGEIVFNRTNLSLLGGFYAIDFNHDGVSDAYLSGNSSSCTTIC